MDVVSSATDGLVTLDAALPAHEHASAVVEALVRAGVRVMEFGPVPLTLADLLESVGVPARADEVSRHA